VSGVPDARATASAGQVRPLGAWASSEEESKPMRGAQKLVRESLGAWDAKTLESSPGRVKGMKGAPNQYGR
jgi:hypothetical protein